MKGPKSSATFKQFDLSMQPCLYSTTTFVYTYMLLHVCI